MQIRHIILICFFLKVCVIKAAIIVWSSKKFEISPLLPFDDEDLEKLVTELGVNDNVFLFKITLKSKNALLPSNFKDIIDPFYSSYNPNGNVGTSNAIGLSLSEDCTGMDTNKIYKTTGNLDNATDFLCILDITYARRKRSANESTTSDDILKKSFTPKGPVIYIGQTKKNDEFALLYSSKPLKLEINNNTKYLGNTDNTLITVDKRFNIPIPLEEKGKVILRFGISFISGYWYLQSAKVELIGEINGSSMYDLVTEEKIMAPAHFSYHCNGQSIFLDSSSGTKLTIYDLQVQVDAKAQKFGDANDCVSFTTAPIWSGLFVTSILGFGLILALVAIMDIKAMDKFDNQATKNLGITVMD